MSDIIGRGVIEVSADASKLKAGIDDAKRSINGMGDAAAKATAAASRSIDKYIKDLQTQNATVNMSTREADRYRLALRGATAEQLAAADAAHRLREANERGAQIGKAVAIGVAAIAAGAIASAVAFDQLIKKAGDFQDMAEKTGDSAENIASLAVAAGTASFEMNDVAGLAVKLSKNLVGVDDDSKAAGAAIKALGLSLEDMKKMGAADRLETIAKALNGFSDSAAKGDVAVALLGKAGADALPFLKELGQEGGRQVILTNQQIAQADEYADKQAKMRTEIGLYAQAIATKMLPSLTDLTGAIKDSISQIAGIDKGAKDLAKNNSIGDFADKAVLSLSYLIDGVTGLARAYELLETSRTRSLHALHLVGKGQFSEAIEYAKDSKAIYQEILDRPLVSTKLQRRIADRQISEFNKENGNSNDNYVETADTARPPRLNFNGAAPDPKKASNDAAKIAGAQLALDITDIRQAGQERVSAYASAERLMEARRSAGLIDERDYYDAKLGFLNLNNAAQESALTQEIARLEQERSIATDKLAISKKIAEAEGKLATVRNSAGANAEILQIQEEGRARKERLDLTEKIVAEETRAAEQNASNTESIRQSLLTQSEVENELYGKRLLDLVAFGAAKVENEVLANELIERETQRHNEWMAEAQARNNLSSISMTAEAANEVYDVLKNAGAERTALGKTLFLAQKGLAVAEIIMNANLAAAKTEGELGLFGIPMATYLLASGYARAGVVAGLAIAEVSGGRALGGPVSAGKMYEVNEKGPELLSSGGKDFLMMGKHGGVVVPNNRLAQEGGGDSSGGAITLNPSYTFNIDSRSDQAQIQQMIVGGVKQGNADLVDKLQRAGRI